VEKEVMVWAHAGGLDQTFDVQHIAGRYKQHGTTYDIVAYPDFTDSEAVWDYIALVPRTDDLKSTLDMRAILTKLIDLGLISEKDFVNGYELGAEIAGGKGTLDINHISQELDTYGADRHANNLTGTADRDRIFGLAGNDAIKSGGGNDFISGGQGTDTLTGGGGRDTFYFNDLTPKHDVISDFAHGKDAIALDSDIFTALGEGDLPADAFRQGHRFHADTRLLYMASTGRLSYDADGSGTADSAHLIAVLENHAQLKYSDFDVL
jgi:Ca2+-binding RTX toxin-like protein